MSLNTFLKRTWSIMIDSSYIDLACIIYIYGPEIREESRQTDTEREQTLIGYVDTNPFSYVSVFDRTKTDTNIRVHTSVFESFSTVHTNTKGIRFRNSPPWKAFSKAFVFVGQGVRFPSYQCGHRRKRIEKYAYSNENGLVWTGGLRVVVNKMNITVLKCCGYLNLYKRYNIFDLHSQHSDSQ